MLIVASKRTDIVNWYMPWFMNRLQEGYAKVKNPYNSKQVSTYNLDPTEIDAIIFYSKNFQPIFPYLDYIMSNYYTYYQYTITGYDNDTELNVPSVNDSINTLIHLSNIVGKERLVWRYDPILLTTKYTIDYHREAFTYITSKVYKYINHCVINFVEMYKKLAYNMPEIIPIKFNEMDTIVEILSTISSNYNMELRICAKNGDFSNYNIQSSACIDIKDINKANNVNIRGIKTTRSEKGCICASTRDIGSYNTCANGCKYCFANDHYNKSLMNYRNHDPNSEQMM